jgi:hypothetical protein
MRRAAAFILILALCLFMAAGASACGVDENGTTGASTGATTSTATSTSAGAGTGSGSSGDLESQLSDLESLEATVTVTQNGEVDVIWSQKQGSWRWQDPNDETSYVIYNKQQDKLWIVDGDTATESTGVGSEGQAWWGMSPAALIKSFTMFPGTRTGDTWEMSVPGGGSIKVEFKGPQGLPTRLEAKTPGDPDEVIEFAYKDVGNVSDDLFVLPAGVSVTAMPDIGGAGGASNLDIPDVNIPNMPE